MSNASPYVTVSQLKARSGENLHLAGKIVPGSVQSDLRAKTLRFRLRDDKGGEINIDHRGDIPSNMNEATSVVAIGGMKDGTFVSEKLLVKCPSRYENDDKKRPGAVANR